MKILNTFLFALSFLISINVGAATVANDFGKETLRAGDDISAEIRTLTQEAFAQLKGSVPEFDQLVEQVTLQLPNLQAYYSDEPLIAEMNGANQASIALNFPKYGLILFDRVRWPKIQSRAMRQAIALHEVMSLVGLEKTGVYYVSSAFLVGKGLTVEQMKTALSGGGEISPTGSMTCDASLDRLFFRYEVWLRKFDSCRYGGYEKHQQLDSDEIALRESSEQVMRLCGANPKKLSAASKVQTIIGTLKGQIRGKCGI